MIKYYTIILNLILSQFTLILKITELYRLNKAPKRIPTLTIRNFPMENVTKAFFISLLILFILRSLTLVSQNKNIYSI